MPRAHSTVLKAFLFQNVDGAILLNLFKLSGLVLLLMNIQFDISKSSFVRHCRHKHRRVQHPYNLLSYQIWILLVSFWSFSFCKLDSAFMSIAAFSFCNMLDWFPAILSTESPCLLLLVLQFARLIFTT